MNGVHLYNRQRDVLAQLDLLFNRGLLGQSQIILGYEPLQIVADIRYDSTILEPDYTAVELHAHRMTLGDLEPRIFLRLFEPEGNPLVIRIDVEDEDLDRVALPRHFGRVLYAFGPRHIRDVDQPVDTRLDLHESAKGSKVANLPVDPRVHWILHWQHHPRILLGLLHPERDFFFAWINLQHDCFDRLSNRNHGRWMAHRAGPTHFADVNQAFDTGLQLDESSIIGNADHLTLQAGSNRVFLSYVLPRIFS